MKVKSKFRFKQIVKHKLGDAHFFVDGIAIYSTGAVLYGCSDKDGGLSWFKDYELEGKRQRGPAGFTININDIKQ